jgi:hypothetical protein
MEREKTQDTRPVYMGTYLKDKKVMNDLIGRTLDAQSETLEIIAKLEIQNRVAIGIAIGAITISIVTCFIAIL